MSFFNEDGMGAGVMVNMKTCTSECGNHLTGSANRKFWQALNRQGEGFSVFFPCCFGGKFVEGLEVALKGIADVLLGFFERFALGYTPGESRDVGGITAFLLWLENRIKLHVESIAGFRCRRG